MSKFINISVLYQDNTICEGADIYVSGFPHLSTQTDSQGKAVIIYPNDTTDIEISANNISIYNGKVADIPMYGIVARLP